MIACENGHTEVVELLLNHLADVNKANNAGVTPLMIACKNGHTEVVELLLKYLADVNLTSIYGRKAFSIVASTNVLKLFLKYGVNTDEFADYYRTDIIRDMFSEMVSEMIRDEKYHRDSISAFFNENQNERNPKEIIDSLEKVLYINYQDETTGDTALHRAIQLNDSKLLNAILNNPNIDATSLNLKNKIGHTPMTELFLSGIDKKNITKIAKLFLKFGAKISENSLVKNVNWLENKGNISQVEIWEDSPEKTELLKLFRLQLLKEGKLAKYFKENILAITEETKTALSEIITFLITHDVISEITKKLIEELELFMSKNDGIGAIDIDMRKFKRIRSMGV
jgi:ankyrin repeat protein